MEFFKKRAELKLQLREMALQVEAKKVAYKRKKVAARQPLTVLQGCLGVGITVSSRMH